MRRSGQAGQALPLVLGVGLLILMAGGVVFTVGRAYAAKADAQTAADVVAIGVGRRMHSDLIAMAAADAPSRAGWRRRIASTGRRLAGANGGRLASLELWPPSSWPPSAVRVTVATPGPLGTAVAASAEAEIRPGTGTFGDASGSGGQGEYSGPLVLRHGKPTCPPVAAAFDVMAAAARAAGVRLVINSAFRSDREQAILFARHPDPKWVAPPGRSRHRNATELDIAGTPGAWEWLARHARGFGFVQRYAWEPWHYGYLPGCGPGPTGSEPRPVSAPEGPSADPLPTWVPGRYRAVILRAASVGGVPPVVLASLLRAESGFDPTAVSPAGAQGIAQFMPGTARGMGLTNPFDPDAAILAAGRLLGMHLRRFGSVPLALAAYNAGPGAVTRYGGVPPYAETRAYITRIMALAGDPSLAGAQSGGGEVVLVRIGDLLA